jgi:beta-glucanase (GH16 family)
MKLRSRRNLSTAIIASAALFFAACSDNNRPVPLSEVDTVPPGAGGPQSNVNIDNPTLAVADNFEVSPGDALTLVWSDEFDGAALDPEVWFFATGDGTEVGLPGGWGNAELQWYLPDSAQLEDGVLKITARLESVEGRNYTSARLNTEDRFAFKYGRIEARIKLPAGQGLWPAFWMLPQDSPYGEWAAKGEIDVVEAVNLGGTNGNEIFATIHYGGEFPANESSGVTYDPGPNVTEDFHDYAIEWDEFEIRWYFDGALYAVQNNWFSTAAPYPAPFDQPFHILLNLAVGGNFPGFAIDNSVFPATMEVDWVRVYSGEDNVIPADPGIIPEAAIFATDPNDPTIVEDLTPPGVDNFGSGAVFDFMFAGDADFNPAMLVTSGEGYGAGVHVGFVAFTGYAAGFADSYENFIFKVKGDAANLGSFEVKFIGGTDTSVLYDIPNYAGSQDLGNGWWQVSVPMTDFAANIAVNDGVLLGPAGGQPAPFSIRLTDIGFTGTSGGGPGAGITPDNVVFATDPNVPEDLAPPGVDNFGSGAVFDFNFAGDADFNPALQAVSGEGYGMGVHVAFVAFTGYAAGFADSFENFVFKIKADAANLGSFEVKFIGGTDTSVLYDLTTYGGVTDLGNGWMQVSLPMSDFAANIAANSGFLLGPAGGQPAAFSYLMTDIGFTGSGGGGNPPVGDGNFVNGDFETGDFTGWTLTQIPDTRGSIALDNSMQGGRAGTVARLVAAGDASGTNDVLISQVALAAGTVAPGDTIDVSFDLFGSLTGAGGVVFVEVIFLDASGQDVGGRDFVGPAAPYTPTDTWTNHSGSVIAGTATGGSQWDVSGGVTLQLKAACGAIAGGCGVDASFDNVTFTIN